jgi:NOL1/NOP2/fmu family ribosome biogenesis protein
MAKRTLANIRFLDKKETEVIYSLLKNQFGVEDFLGKFLMIGSERIFLYTGDFNSNELDVLQEDLPVERIGVYFGKIYEGEIRLSLEGVDVLKEKIVKGIFNLEDSLVSEWMSGADLFIEHNASGFVVIENKGLFLGCGKACREKISNFIPKSRRLKLRG